MGFNGATCVYAWCITVAHVYVKNLNFLLFTEQDWETESIQGNGRPSKHDV